MFTVSTSNYHHGNLREALICSGLSLLRTGGTAALTLRAAARHAGVSPMAPYRHFADKDALLAAIVAEGFGRFAQALETADNAKSALDAMREQAAAYVDFATTEPALFRLMFGIEAPVHNPDVGVASSAAYAVLRRRVATLVAPADVELATLSAWSMVHGLAMLVVDRQIDAPDPRSLARQVINRFAAQFR